MPLRFDAIIVYSDFGYYAHILVDIELSKPPLDSLMLEKDDLHFYIYFEYENFSTFCSVSSFLSHLASSCRTIRPKDSTPK